MTNFMRNIGDAGQFKSRMTNTPFLNAIYKQQLETGNAFLAIRNQKATIYYNGNQLCDMAKTPLCYEPCVYSKYLPFLRSRVLTKGTSAKSISENDWLKETDISGYTFEKILPEILDNIEKDSSPESIQVSNLYKFSPLCTSRAGDIVLLDVEAEFAASNKKAERIDVVLYHTVERQLIFVEVKRLSDGRIREKNGAPAEVITQLKGYKSILDDAKEKRNLLDQYNNVILFFNSVYGLNLPQIDENRKLLLGLLLVELTRSKEDQMQIDNIAARLNGVISVCPIGNMVNAGASTLQKWYNAFSR